MRSMAISVPAEVEREASLLAPQPGRWVAKPLKSRIGYAAIHAIASSLFLIFMFVALAAAPHLNKTSFWVCLPVFLEFFIVVPFWLANEYRVLRFTKADAALLERPENLEEFPVEITIRAGLRTIGADRGVVYFDQDLIGFSGGRTSFLLSARDLSYPRVNSWLDFDQVYRPLSLNADNVTAEVAIRPLVGFGRRFRRRLRAFLRADVAAKVARQWPPLEPYQEQPVEKRLARGS